MMTKKPKNPVFTGELKTKTMSSLKIQAKPFSNVVVSIIS